MLNAAYLPIYGYLMFDCSFVKAARSLRFIAPRYGNARHFAYFGFSNRFSVCDKMTTQKASPNDTRATCSISIRFMLAAEKKLLRASCYATKMHANVVRAVNCRIGFCAQQENGRRKNRTSLDCRCLFASFSLFCLFVGFRFLLSHTFVRTVCQWAGRCPSPRLKLSAFVANYTKQWQTILFIIDIIKRHNSGLPTEKCHWQHSCGPAQNFSHVSAQ